MFIFVADLHALTIDINPEKLRENKKNIMAIYLAAGLDSDKVTLFYQSDVKAHGQMNWIIENQTTIGELSRMTQFKDKSKTRMSNGTEKINTGLLTYPTLMAGDILLYKPQIVPVGKDQKQHIELTKNIAQRFNRKYGNTFLIPEFYTPETGSKIMSLTDPSKKMSKSSNIEKSYISLFDEPDIAYKKIMKAVTDSEGKVYASPEKPGITNLLTIYASLKDITLKDAEDLHKNMNYGEFKKSVGEVVKNFLIELQKKYDEAIKISEKIAKLGKDKAKKIANETLAEVEFKIGL